MPTAAPVPTRALAGVGAAMATAPAIATAAVRLRPFRNLSGASAKFLRRGNSGKAETAGRPMTPATAPDERMFVLVPVGGCAFDGVLDLGPGLEASALQRQGAHDLPPGLDQV